MKKIIFMTVVLFTLSSLANTAPAEKEKKESIPKDKSAESKVATKAYTDEEFKKAVNDELIKQQKRMGQDNLVEFSQELLKKEEQLKVKEMEISKREEQLSINMKEFEKKINEFQAKQNKIIGCLDENDKNKNQRITHMVNTISGMKPATAAEILSVQDAEIAVKILGQLDSDKVAKIFNLMNKEISARLQKQYMDMKK